ncbi:hypothetical protein [Sphingomonas leidyi]|uniref:hypothetical protein n=1 Tax=Sphingomonas leidyi TaxID=68569 RepID=UPI0036D28801
MKLIQPIPVSDAMLVASTVPETDYPAWSPIASYAAGARVVRLHRVFESLIAGNLDRDPAAAAPGSWLDVGPTNRWAMFDPGAGPRTTAPVAITVTLVPGRPVTSIGLLDLTAASVRVQVSSGGTALYDTTREGVGSTLTLFDLPAVEASTLVITIAPTNGEASTGKLIIGTAADLGVTETSPTISLVDYSRRETDAFGVTTVVQRAWAKRIALRTRIAAKDVDDVRRHMVAARATAALWIGEPEFDALTLYGFYKEFELALELGEVSFFTLTVEGLPEADASAPAIDPAPAGVSDFKVIRPALITDATLTASNVPEADYPAWSAIANYAAGERCTRAGTHRVYESAVDGNVGYDPAAGPVQWVDAGPTNRWAMFDQALGTTSTATGSIVVTVAPGVPITALAVLDVVGASVRVQAPGYDRTQLVNGDAEALTFLDLGTAAGASITVTVAAGAGEPVLVGTLLVGTLTPLGQAETQPTIGITDFSRKDTDDFGTTTVVQRAWAKRMAVRSLVSSAAVGGLLRGMASLRATPALWIASEGFDSLVVYGFYRDFSVEVADGVSTCSVTVEGLSTAAPLPAADTKIRWLGDWQGDQSYPLNGVVRHNGRSFASLIAGNLGHEPPLTAEDNAFWYLVSDRGEDGEAGSQGIPGAPGANGQTSYVHFAWANSADGATGFSTTVSAGKLYIGVYVDFTPADSTNPALYSWSKIKGEDGLQGVQGIPGAPGANGQTTYFHVAYADSADGSINFTTGAPGSRTYIGVYTDFTAADSASPGAYVWSKYVGADGSQGIPGAPGANGQTSYVHFAWANSADGATGFSTTVSAGKLYIGVYTDFTAADSTNPALYHWSKIKGDDGLQGSQGVPGAPGSNGQTTYFHTAYADSADGTSNFTTGDAGTRAYIGVYTDFTAADSANPAAYVWSRYKGFDGSQGIPGAPGANGQTSYVHFAWANSADGATGFSTTVSAGKLYIGVYSDFTASSSTNPALYSWSLIKGNDGLQGSQGVPGAPGSNGLTSYVHFAYADSADGTSNFTTGAADGRYYVGVYVDFATADSTNPAVYTWSLQRGSNGSNGTPGAPGSNGQPSYVHTAYASSPDGTSNFHTSDPSGRTYLGVYSDFTLADSTNPASYTWSLIKGADGAPGAPAVSPIVMTLSAYSIDVAADYNNVTKTGSLPKSSTVSLVQGTTPIAPLSVYFVYSDGGSGAFAASYDSSTQVVSLNTANSAGWVDVVAIYAAQQYAQRISVTRSKDPAPPSSQTSAATAVSGGNYPLSTSYGGAIMTPELVLKANASGVINCAFDGEYYADQDGASVRTLRIAARFEVAPQSSGVFSAPVSEEVGSQSTWDKSDVSPGMLSMSRAITGLTPNDTYRLRVSLRKSIGSNVGGYINYGQFSVSQ